jgi:hypothetical protein
MVLLEAMVYSLLCCFMIVLVVQESIMVLTDSFVEDGNQDEFIKQLQLLMSNETLRLEMG